MRGRTTFQMSEMNGLENLADELTEDDIVLVHYGDSPMVSSRSGQTQRVHPMG